MPSQRNYRRNNKRISISFAPVTFRIRISSRQMRCRRYVRVMSRALVLIFECGLYGTLFCLIARFLRSVFFLIFVIIDEGHRCGVPNFKRGCQMNVVGKAARIPMFNLNGCFFTSSLKTTKYLVKLIKTCQDFIKDCPLIFEKFDNYSCNRRLLVNTRDIFPCKYPEFTVTIP